MAKTINRRLAELIDSSGQLTAGKLPDAFITTAHYSANSITDAKLHTSFSLPASALTARDTGDLSEGSNLYYTDTRADARIAAADTGDLSEGSNLYYTDARVQTYISGDRSYGNITTTGYIAGPASMVIDPAGVGDNTGTVVIAGNLQVDGTTTTINSTTVSIDDLNFTIASDAADSSEANGAGITIGGASATMLYTHATTSFDFNKPVNVTGNIGVTGTVDGVDIAARDAVLTSTTTTANAALPLAGGTMTGELGIGVTPGAWSVNYPALQIGQGATFTGHISNTQTQLGQNWWVGTGNQYVVNGAASRLVMGTDSSITFSQAPSGTAGATMSTITNPLVINSSGNATFSGDVGMATGHSSGKFAVMSSSVHGTYDFYNNGTSYFNGSVIVDDVLNVTGTNKAIQMNGVTRINGVGDIIGTSYYVGGTNVIDTSRNLTNIGTISSGAITTTGDTTIKNSGVAKLKFAPLGSNYGAGFDVMTVTGTSSSPYTSTIGFSNYGVTDAMVIKGNNVGIGNTAPVAKLHIKGAGTYNHTPANPLGADFVITSSEMSDNNAHSIMQLVSVRQSLTTGSGSTGYVGFSTIDDSNDVGINDAARIAIVNEVGSSVASPTALSFWTNAGTGGSTGAATEKMRISSNGNVGIGQTAGTYNKLVVKGTVIGTAANLAETAQLAILSLNYPRGNVNSGIHFGYATANYIQAADDSGANAKNLTLNPYGGNVGIGTANPSTRLDVESAAAGTIAKFFDTGSNGGAQYNGAAVVGISRVGNGTVSLAGPLFQVGNDTSSSTAYNIDEPIFTVTNANVGIGTDAPSELLEVKKTTANAIIKVQTGGGNDARLILDAPAAGGAQSQIFFDASGTTAGSIQYTHNSGGTNFMTFHTGGSNTERMRITADGVVSAPIASTHGGMLHGAHTPNPEASYLGSNGADFGTIAIYRTPVITSSASTAATSQFLSIYSSGHWSEYPVFRFKVYGTYYVAGYREYVGYLTASNADLVEVQLNGTTSFIGGGGNNTITMSSAVSSGLAANGGQARYRRDFTLTNHGAYGRCYVVVEIMYGGNRYYGSNTTTADLDADGDSGGSYHFKTMSLAQGQGTFSST
jgi:hypothetical protein